MDKNIGVITEQGDLGLGFDEISASLLYITSLSKSLL